MNVFFEQIETQIAAKKPFVVYKKPMDGVVNAILQSNDELHYTANFEETGFVFAPFNISEKSLPILIASDEILKANYKAISENQSKENVHIDELITDKNYHINLVKKGICAIEDKVFKKVVLSRAITVKNKRLPLELFKELLEEYTNAFCYLWYHPKVGMWLGATPEVFLKTQNRRIETSSLAGTQVYRANETPEWEAKEIEEQELVTQFVKDALVDKVTNVSCTEKESVKAGNLWHLRTKISGLMKGSLKTIITALHPTPATCGLPKQVSKAFILENENYNRKFYTGFLGELNFKVETQRSKNRRNIENTVYTAIKKETNLFVNLRCAEILDDSIQVFVGGGITKSSNPQKEWEETIAKSGTILRIILK